MRQRGDRSRQRQASTPRSCPAGANNRWISWGRSGDRLDTRCCGPRCGRPCQGRGKSFCHQFSNIFVRYCFLLLYSYASIARHGLTGNSRSHNLANAGTTSCASDFLQDRRIGARTEGVARGCRGRLSLENGVQTGVKSAMEQRLAAVPGRSDFEKGVISSQ